MFIDVKENRNQRTVRVLSEFLGEKVNLWRRLTKQQLIKQSKALAKEIHSLIKEYDLNTTIVWAYPESANEEIY